MLKGKNFIILIIIALVLVIAFIISRIVLNAPKAPEKAAVDRSVLVNAFKVNLDNYSPIIKSFGKVEPSQQIDLISEVSGSVINVNKNFVPGGIVKKGTILLEIDPTDSKIALINAKSSLSNAQSAYRQALGKSEQAKKELQLYEKSTGKKVKDSYLALKKPALEQASANLEQAKANFSQAQLNVERTKVKAPFDLIIKDTSISNGSYVSTGSKLASIVNSSVYWVKASLPIQNLSYIDFTGHVFATISSVNQSGSRKVAFFKLLNYLDEQSRLMGAIFTVNDPLLLASGTKNNNQFKVFLGDYVSIEIKGKEIKDIFKIPLYTLKSNNTVWLIKNNRLVITPVKLIYQDNDYAYIKGLSSNDLIISSDMALVSNNMLVKINSITQ